ncbi:MAG: AAC(3) family N-acetyltransferase [Oscillospiraceae bacterium]|nr:AAC(3) family N-acetyltransferase [Oscillospiraceae bacterium]
MGKKTHDFDSLTKDFTGLGIKPDDNVLIHSSMKSIGEVTGGADTVLDVFCKYLSENGNIALPSHSWEKINAEYNIFDPVNEPSCVGILTEIFRKREGVIRSLHPTHSIAVTGKDSEYFVRDEHLIDTPCGREGCWGKLFDMDFKIIFLGCSAKRNTYLHGVEEWLNIPDRLTESRQPLKIIMPDGEIFDRPMRRHHNKRGVDVSDNYDKIIPYMQKENFIVKGVFGDAECILMRARDIYKITAELLENNMNFFGE